MKVVKFVKEFARQQAQEKQERLQREAEHRAWNEAGRPTGPGCDTSWKK